MNEITVLTWGIFDLIHPGHMRLLRKARWYGTRLVVGINSDDSVQTIRMSDNRPVMNELERAYVLRHVVGVDEVRIFDAPNAADLIYSVRPRFAVKGGSIPVSEELALSDVHAKFIYLPPLPSHPHTTELIGRAYEIYCDEQGIPCHQRKLR